jgi:hypothetical protein
MSHSNKDKKRAGKTVTSLDNNCKKIYHNIYSLPDIKHITGEIHLCALSKSKSELNLM